MSKRKMGKMTVPRWKRFEREIARKFRRWFPDARRGMQFQDGDYAPDVVGKDLPFYVECKTGQKYLKAEGKSFNPDNDDKIRELLDIYQRKAHLWHTENGGPDLPPIIIYKRPRRIIRVVLYGSIYNTLTKSHVMCNEGMADINWGSLEQCLDDDYGTEAPDA